MIDERGFTGHAYYLYEHLLHVPLVVRFPQSVPAETRVERAVSLRDLPAMILDLAGVADVRIPGVSLAAAWRDSTAQLSPVFAEVARVPRIAPRFPTSRGPMDAVFDDSLHLIRGPGDSTEVYRYRSDSLELEPIALSDSASGPRRATLRQLIESMRRVPGAQ
jgi:arylsulfatase A-like enzyme